MSSVDPNCPVLIGVGQNTWRDRDVSRTPIDALTDVATMALKDTGVDAINELIDCVVNVSFITDTNPAVAALLPRNPGAALAERLKLPSAQLFKGALGGNSPQYLVNQLAQKLVEGECSVALLAGVELLDTFFNALKTQADISAWADGATPPATLGEEREGLNETEQLHGLYEPINTYPLFENALKHKEQRDSEAHQQLLGNICSAMSQVAAQNPLAWRQQLFTPADICQVSKANRIIGYPYTKLMNAILTVDMAAAIVMTTAGKARELGIAEDRLVYLRAGVDLNDIWHISERENLYSSPAIGAAARAALAQAQLKLDDIDCFDIYSCFPSAVEIACNEIGLSPLDPRGVTVTGGLPFFGGPGNNYSLHAIAEVVARLRADEATVNGLVTANGLYLTKHSVGIYSSQAPCDKWSLLDNKPLQKAIDQGPSVHLDQTYAGKVTIETYTVAYDREGPKEGYIIARNPSGHRVIANTGRDIDTLSGLLQQDPIGMVGYVEQKETGAVFRF